MQHPLVDFLKTMHPFTPEEEQLIAVSFEYRSYREDEFMFRAGSACREMFFITKGLFMIMEPNAKGVPFVQFFIGKDQFLTILSCYNEEGISKYSLLAACDSEALAIPNAKLEDLCIRIPYLQGLVEKVIHNTLLKKVKIRNSYNGNDATTRYRLFLEQQPDVAQNVSLGYIASYLGITQQSLSRIRKNMHLT